MNAEGGKWPQPRNDSYKRGCMTWTYSSFEWRVNWSAEPQTVAVPCAVQQCVWLS
jgi:hypothetical protein